MLAEFQRIGLLLSQSGLVTSHGGNLSVRVRERVLITRRDAMLACLSQGDLVAAGLKQTDCARASRELPVHQVIYCGTGNKAVVHAHPLYAVALSLVADRIVPVDSEGAVTLGAIPVLSIKDSIGSAEVAAAVPGLLAKSPIVVLRGHGSFAAAGTLEEALRFTSVLEFSSRILWLARAGEERR